MTKEEIEMYVEELIKERTLYINKLFSLKKNTAMKIDIIKDLLCQEFDNILYEYFCTDEDEGWGKKDENDKWLFLMQETEHFNGNENSPLYFTEEEFTTYLNILFKKVGWNFQFKENFVNEETPRDIEDLWGKLTSWTPPCITNSISMQR